MKLNRLPWLLILLGASLALIMIRAPATQWVPIEHAGAVAGDAGVARRAPVFESANIGTAAPVNHASDVLALEDGTRLVVWFAGSKEGAQDVQLLQSTKTTGAWGVPRVIHTVAGTSASFGYYNKKIGNPVLFSADDGQIHLVFVTVALGGWGGSRLAHCVSHDQGRTWSKPRLWRTSPFVNISTQARHGALPIRFTDGAHGWLLPVHYEFVNKYPKWLVLSDDGRLLYQKRMPVPNGLIQPALLARDGGVRAYFRASGLVQPQIFFADYRRQWVEELRGTGLPNSDAGIAVIELPDKRLLMAFNPSVDGRSSLALALSDDGARWRVIAELENSAGEEFSYPSLALHGEEIDLTYTFKRKWIKHLRFNSQWLDLQAGITAK